MRILHIATERGWRGGENQLRLLLQGLAHRNVENWVACRPGSEAALRFAKICSVVELPLRGSADPRSVLQLIAHCRKIGVQLIDAHSSIGHSLALTTKLLRPQLKLIVHRRVDYIPGRSWINRKKYLSAKVDRYVTISRTIREILCEYGIPKNRVITVRSAVDPMIYQGIDRGAAKMALAKAIGISSDQTFIGNASALTDQKGHNTLIRAIGELKRRNIACHCFIAGAGELRKPLEKLRGELSLDHDVTFLGFVKDTATFLSSLDILATPSNFEGLGTVIMDGVYAGCAIAASDVGGIPEMIVHNETGLLSPVGDHRTHAANLATLIENRSLRSKLTKSAQVYISKEFSVEGMVSGNYDVYRSVIGTE